MLRCDSSRTTTGHGLGHIAADSKHQMQQTTTSQKPNYFSGRRGHCVSKCFFLWKTKYIRLHCRHQWIPILHCHWLVIVFRAILNFWGKIQCIKETCIMTNWASPKHLKLPKWRDFFLIIPTRYLYNTSFLTFW